MNRTTRPRGPRAGGPRRGGPPRSAHVPHGPHVEPLHPSSEPPDITSFDHWALAPEVLEAIAGMGITSPTPIQRLAIQPALERRDVIAQAETGTGKTLAFGAPVMSKIDPSRVSVQALVLTPTRELAEQVSKVLEELGRAREISVALIVGGEPAKPQVDALKAGAQVVVGTPGRVLDLMGQGFLSFPWTEFVVLDEADEMLEIGFLDDVEKILLATDPEIRNTLLFSATFPPELLKLARKHSQNPAEIATASGVATVDKIEQDFFVVHDEDRPMALIRMIEQSGPDDVLLVFCERRTEVERLIRRLERLPYPIKALHGGYDQEARFRVMGAFRRREVKALVATDVASRGLDVAHVTHVVNYSVPRDITAYTHRIGRTGRAGREGHATTLVPSQQARRWQAVLRAATWQIEEVQAPGPTVRRRDEGRRPERREEGRPVRKERRERTGRAEGSEAAREPRAEERGRRPAGLPAPPRSEGLAQASAFGRDIEPVREPAPGVLRQRRAEDRGSRGPDRADAPSGLENGQRPRRRRRPRSAELERDHGAQPAEEGSGSLPRRESRPAHGDARRPIPELGVARGEPRPSEPRPGEPRPGEPRPGDVGPGEPRRSERRPNERRPNERRPNEQRPEREQCPEREQRPERKPAEPRRAARVPDAPDAPDAAGGFGAGVLESGQPRRARPDRRAPEPPAPARAPAPAPAPTPRPSRAPEPPAGGGFGAGI